MNRRNAAKGTAALGDELTMSKRYRPKLAIRREPLGTVVEVLALIGVGVCVLTVALSWSTLPETSPRHFDLSGEPDAWIGKGMLLFMPLLVAVVYAGLTVTGRYPHWFNFPVRITEQNAHAQYRIAVSLLRWIKLEIIYVFAIDVWITVRAATEQEVGQRLFLLLLIIAGILVTVVIHVVAAFRAR